ncbi:ROK family protein [Actinomyces ruminis]|uniref:ROK family protein n=1 Tax=Actinomyces ruminis TaxID=1937003 RepID=A0ABX4MBZ4_9ACTO|nr:ROK family protein [Actinomyces ruminis]PHP52766.1 ROK family protein [Actinomyces ruminis]
MAGGWALLRDARRAAVEGLSPHLKECLDQSGELTTEDIVAGVNAGDTECVTLMVRSATAVGDALAMLVSFFNPGQVVLAGPMPQGCPMFLDVVKRIVDERALSLATAGLEILPAASGLDDELRGCALLAVCSVFKAATA